MKFNRIKAIAKKEAIQLKRDPLSLLMAFLMPVLLLFIFGYAITLDVDNLTTVVSDRDKSPASREFISTLARSGYFSITAFVDDARDIDPLFEKGKAKAAFVIPEGFSKSLKRGAGASLQAVIDASDAGVATVADGYISAAVNFYGAKAAASFGAPPPAIDPQIRAWYNPALKSRNFIIPGLIAVIMAVIAALLTSLTISREWERGTMEALISTPVKTWELIIGKITPYFAIGIVDMLSAVLVTVYVFNIPLKGSTGALVLFSSLFLFGGLCFGILISIVSKSQLVASQIAMVSTFLPAFLLSGFVFSISNMPLPLRALTRAVPARYFVSALKAIFLKGSALNMLMAEALLLVLYAAVIFAVAGKKLKKKMT